MNQIEKLLRNLPTMDEYSKKQIADKAIVDCWTCEGTGWVNCDCCGAESDCEECEGTGKRVAEPGFVATGFVYETEIMKITEKWIQWTGCDRFEAYARVKSAYPDLCMGRKPFLH